MLFIIKFILIVSAIAKSKALYITQNEAIYLFKQPTDELDFSLKLSMKPILTFNPSEFLSHVACFCHTNSRAGAFISSLTDFIPGFVNQSKKVSLPFSDVMLVVEL